MECTTLLACEPLALEEDSAISSIVDGILYLHKEVSPERIIDLRSLHIEKFRGSDYLSGFHPLRITLKGIEIFPHIIEKYKETPLDGKKYISDISDLDKLLGGGLEHTTSTIISGPSGVGKSTLAMQFLVHAALRGEGAILYAFEETKGSIVSRARNLGIDVDPLLEKELLKIIEVNPLDLYPDEFLQMIRTSVEKEGSNLIALDSLKGYYLAMDQFGSPIVHLQNAILYLKSAGKTSIVINETENLTGNLKMTETGVSFLSDNIIFIRYLVQEGRIIRGIGCLKKRMGKHETEIRELLLTPNGIQVGKRLQYLAGLPITEIPRTNSLNGVTF